MNSNFNTIKDKIDFNLLKLKLALVLIINYTKQVKKRIFDLTIYEKMTQSLEDSAPDSYFDLLHPDSDAC